MTEAELARQQARMVRAREVAAEYSKGLLYSRCGPEQQREWLVEEAKRYLLIYHTDDGADVFSEFYVDAAEVEAFIRSCVETEFGVLGVHDLDRLEYAEPLQARLAVTLA